MELDCQNFAQERIAKMNSSNLAFKELIESLRIKNKQNNVKALSEINPESDKSNSSQVCFSQAQINNKSGPKHINLISPIPNNSSVLQVNNSLLSPANKINEDDVIRLKPRGSVAGRDILNRKPNTIPAQSFTETANSLKNTLKNKNIEQQEQTAQSSIKKQQEKTQEQPIMARKLSNLQNISNVNKVVNAYKKQQQQQILPTQTNNTSILKIQKKNSFNQNKLNSKMTFNKKIKDIDQQLLIKYCNNSAPLTKYSQAAEVFQFFQGLLKICKIHIQCPLIKKFKNCIYFGQQLNDNQKYQGFLFFYTKKIYYGEFFNGQKNGNGVQILFDDEIIYKGTFTSGEKTGKFYVRNNQNHQEYIGFLEKGNYHGKGKLINKEFIYEGDFYNGEKHGFGEQYHQKTGVKFTGYFNRGQFQKRSKSSFDKHQLQRGISFKPNHSKTKNFNGFNGSTPKISHHNNNRSYAEFPNQNKRKFSPYLNDLHDGLEVSPFSSSQGFMGYEKNHSRNNKLNYNKQKIRSYMPQVRAHFHEPLPENFQDFDYSFDTSSKQTSENSLISPFYFNSGNSNNGKRRQSNYGYNSNNMGYGPISHFPQIEQQKLNTSQCEDPLPLPAFLPKK